MSGHTSEQAELPNGNALPPTPPRKASGKKAARKAAGKKGAPRKAAAPTPDAQTQPAPAKAPAKNPAKTPQRIITTQPGAKAPPPLMLDLVQILPLAGASFPSANQEAWLAAAKANLGVLYPLPRAASPG